MACTSGGRSEVAAVPEMFPAGLRVLVVDDDAICLRVIEQMLRNCMYRVTSCTKAKVALNLLRERRNCFDIVLSDVHMPDVDGFKLLELVGLEMDLPVIMMSADGRTSLVMRGIRHGACDYLIKPIRDEELKNIWQHVVRKRCGGGASKEHEYSGSMEDHDRYKRAIDDSEYASSVNEGGADEVRQTHKKRRDSNDENDTELENDDPSATKRPRVVWSVELHQQFVAAVNQLGLDKAVPKRILELMNVAGLTRENVASHLQKFRLYLKRLSGVAQHHQSILPTYCGPLDQNPEVLSPLPLGRFDIQALAASGQLPPQTIAALQAELLSQSQPSLLHASSSLHGSPVDRNVAYVQPTLIKCANNQISQPIMSNEDAHARSEFPAWQSKNLADVAASTSLNLAETNSNNMLMSFIQQQQQQRKQQSIVMEPNRSINVQPSCLVVPSNFQAGNSPSSVNQNSGFRNSSGVRFSDFTPAGSVSSVPSCSRNVVQDNNACQRVPSSPSTLGAVMQSSFYNGKVDMMQGGSTNRGKSAIIPSRFAVDEYELGMSSNMNQMNNYGETSFNKVKQEPNMDFMENVKVGYQYGSTFSQMI